jgi:hypothetical protein
MNKVYCMPAYELDTSEARAIGLIDIEVASSSSLRYEVESACIFEIRSILSASSTEIMDGSFTCAPWSTYNQSSPWALIPPPQRCQSRRPPVKEISQRSMRSMSLTLRQNKQERATRSRRSPMRTIVISRVCANRMRWMEIRESCWERGEARSKGQWSQRRGRLRRLLGTRPEVWSFRLDILIISDRSGSIIGSSPFWLGTFA